MQRAAQQALQPSLVRAEETIVTRIQSDKTGPLSRVEQCIASQGAWIPSSGHRAPSLLHGRSLIFKWDATELDVSEMTTTWYRPGSPLPVESTSQVLSLSLRGPEIANLLMAIRRDPTYPSDQSAQTYINQAFNEVDLVVSSGNGSTRSLRLRNGRILYLDSRSKRLLIGGEGIEPLSAVSFQVRTTSDTVKFACNVEIADGIDDRFTHLGLMAGPPSRDYPECYTYNASYYVRLST